MSSTDDRRLTETATDPDFDVVGRRDTRHSEDRPVTENRELSEDDRLEMFRKQLFNDALPDLPSIPGYHTCWLTTANPRDNIHRRMQLGYEPVRPDEIPGMTYATLKTGEYAGLIGINEMVAFKLPQSLYQAFMQEAHHDAPRREEEALVQRAEAMQAEAEAAGAKLIEEEGMRELRHSAPRLGKFES